MLYRKVLFLLLTISLLWMGLILGVSFLATPVKFMAPTLTLPVALDVGRQTFRIFNWLELILAIALVVPVFQLPKHWLRLTGFLVVALVLLKAAWLLPALDARVEVILAGGQVGESLLHNLYIAFDAIKLLCLGTLSFYCFKHLKEIE